MQIRASDKAKFFQVQRNLDLVTLNLVTACDLVTISQRPFFNFVTLRYLVTVFAETKSVTKSRLHCTTGSPALTRRSPFIREKEKN